MRSYWSTSINKTLARNSINSIGPGTGTHHLTAVQTALSLKPEVLFFLTDADAPILRAADLNEIRKKNRGRTRIHCIEFGTGPFIVDSFLKRLAAQNGGTYRYRDVKKFSR